MKRLLILILFSQSLWGVTWQDVFDMQFDLTQQQIFNRIDSLYQQELADYKEEKNRFIKFIPKISVNCTDDQFKDVQLTLDFYQLNNAIIETKNDKAKKRIYIRNRASYWNDIKADCAVWLHGLALYKELYTEKEVEKVKLREQLEQAKIDYKAGLIPSTHIQKIESEILTADDKLSQYKFNYISVAKLLIKAVNLEVGE